MRHIIGLRIYQAVSVILITTIWSLSRTDDLGHNFEAGTAGFVVLLVMTVMSFLVVVALELTITSIKEDKAKKSTNQ